jgi:hypothetical protein
MVGSSHHQPVLIGRPPIPNYMKQQGQVRGRFRCCNAERCPRPLHTHPCHQASEGGLIAVQRALLCFRRLKQTTCLNPEEQAPTKPQKKWGQSNFRQTAGEKKLRPHFFCGKQKRNGDFSSFLYLLAAVFVVGRAGFEPATNGLKVRCSTS